MELSEENKDNFLPRTHFGLRQHTKKRVVLTAAFTLMEDFGWTFKQKFYTNFDPQAKF